MRHLFKAGCFSACIAFSTVCLAQTLQPPVLTDLSGKTVLGRLGTAGTNQAAVILSVGSQTVVVPLDRHIAGSGLNWPLDVVYFESPGCGGISYFAARAFGGRRLGTVANKGAEKLLFVSAQNPEILETPTVSSLYDYQGQCFNLPGPQGGLGFPLVKVESALSMRNFAKPPFFIK